MRFTGERFIPDATDVEPTFQRKMYQEHINRYQFAAFFVTGKRVLDLGCGVGYGDQQLATKRPEFLIGLDAAEDAVGYARRHYGAPGVSFLAGDATEVPFENQSFDVIVCFEVVEHVERYHNLLVEARRVLKDDGLFIVSTPRRKGPPRSAFHVHEFTFDEFRQLLEVYFEKVKFFFQNNLFASVIACDPDWATAFQGAMSISDFANASGDYFIAVCGQADAHPEPLAVLNDDSYVLTLERDVAVLKGDRSLLDTQIEQYQGKVGALEAQVAESEQRIAQLEGQRERLVAESEQRIAQLEEGRERLVAESEQRIAQLEGERERLVAGSEQRIAQLEGERERLVAESEQKIAQLQGGITSLRASRTFRLMRLLTAIETRFLPLRAWRFMRQFGWRLFLRQTVKYLTRASTRIWIDGPSPGAAVTQPFLLAGWAIDTAAAVGTGVDAVQVWAHHAGESSSAPIFLGRAIYGGARPHVGAAFGGQFAHSGYDLAIEGLSPGPYELVVEAHSSVTDSFNNSWATTLSVAGQETTREFRKHLPDPTRFKVLFVVGCLEGESKRYRVHNVQAQLAVLGVQTATIYEIDISDQLDRVVTFDTIVLMRVAVSPIIRRLIELCRRLNIPVVFEIDDYIFEPEIIPYVDGIRGWSEVDKEYYAEGVRRYRETLELCDYFVATTDYLAARAAELGKKSFVIRNGLNERQLQTSNEALKEQKRDEGVVRIGYLSGTPTHQRDFEVAIPALLRIMQEFPQVELSIQGHLDLDDRFEEFRDRVEQRPFVGWEELPNHVARLDINIAPLEIGNPFCEAKSELKYFEPALLRIPTVASATDAFRFAITNGENGFLAETEADWYRYLKELIKKPELRREMGGRAYRHVTSTYTPQAQAEATLKVHQEILRDFRQRLGFQRDALSISWVVPTPFVGSGGHATIFRAARHLSEFGHFVRIYSSKEGDFGTSAQLGAFLDSSFFPTGAEVILGVEDISPCDALIATHWTTAYIAHANRHQAKRIFYFVQDFEPYFHPVGEDYIRAENTYKMGFACVTYGPWLAKMLRERYNANADHCLFELNTSIYYPRKVRKSKRKSVIFFARPDMPRRCFPLGVEALTIFHERNPELEICLFGSDKVDPSCIPFPHRDYGVIRSLDVLATLYSSASVGVAFSTTNPSRVPFEMMACGCPVVDLDYGDNYINYGSRDSVMLVEPTPEGVAEGIELLIRNEELRAKIVRNGLDFARSLPSEEEGARQIESLILKELKGQLNKG